MPPTRSKKAPVSVERQEEIPESPQLPVTKIHEDAMQTPNQSPARAGPAMRISLGQKQALIDNLQLEVTERARKLRAQYNVQAQGLKTRIEIRVNRIPISLRRKDVGELWNKHNNTGTNASRSPLGPPVPPKNSHKKVLVDDAQPEPSTRQSPVPVARAAKRTRISVEAALDKENEHIENPKKRAKAPPILPERTTSRMKDHHPSQVLSPRSANSRTLPVSPIRPASPSKPFLSRPISPIKPMVSLASTVGGGTLTAGMADKAKTTRATGTRKISPHTNPAGAATGRGRRTASATAGPAPKVGKGRGSLSEESNTSTGTTIVRKPVPVKKAPVKKTVMGTIKGMGATKKAPTASTASGGRVLRKRG
ncbi:Borealin- N-terminal protein [Rutstroemia sp. NJR-2017a WRK4]|nr:Borealin- N-terminal protein [Rutstroemia sp. NJR-2017a WRK4]